MLGVSVGETQWISQYCHVLYELYFKFYQPNTEVKISFTRLTLMFFTYLSTEKVNKIAEK
jgi:hypothetical protein